MVVFSVERQQRSENIPSLWLFMLTGNSTVAVSSTASDGLFQQLHASTGRNMRFFIEQLY